MLTSKTTEGKRVPEDQSSEDGASSSRIAESTPRPFRVLQCCRCGFCSNDEETLSQHLQTIHGISVQDAGADKDSETGKLIKCVKCDYSSTNKHCLRQHYDLVHIGERKFKCPFCNYAGKRSSSLKEHLVVHSATPPFRCTICNATFRKKGHLTNHIKMHARNNDCNFCEAKFETTIDLQEHVDKTHSYKPMFTCDFCSFAAKERDNIESHMKSHSKITDIPVYKCAECDYTSVSSQIIRKHLEDTGHGGDGGFQKPANVVVLMKCAECGFTTKDKEYLRAHMVQHIDNSNDAEHSQETYSCSNCSFTCDKAYPFITHILSHKAKTIQPSISDLTEKSHFTHDETVGLYKCNLCGFESEHQRSIKSHIWKHSGHKDIDYPMFQNGPMSVYDITPIGETTLLNNSNHKVKVISMEHKVCDSREDNDFQNFEDEQPQPSRQVRHILQCAWCHFCVSDVQSLEKHLEDAHQIKEKIQVPEDIDLCKVYVVDTDEKEAREIIFADSIEAENDTSEYAENEEDDSECLTKGVIVLKDNMETVYEIEVTSQDGLEYQDEPVSYVAMVADESNDTLKRNVDDAQDSNKRVCKDSVICTSESVVVQQLPQLYGVTYQDSTANSPRASSPHLSRVSSKESLDEDIEEPLVPRPRLQSATSQEVVDLLSLLKKGPNYNPACPPKNARLLRDKRLSEESDIEEGKPKKGICSSLLAVIEQLRERSKSDSDGEGSLDTASQSSGGGKKRRRSRTSMDDTALEHMPNVEHITEEEDGEIRLSYRCKLCHYSNLSASLMKTHMRLHKAKQPSECSLCDYVADSSEQLQDHMLQHCKVRIYQCKLCPSKFHYKSQLRAHMRAHDKVPFISERGQFTCKHCSFETTEPITYHEHLQMHLMREPCEVCGHLEPDPDAQLRHIKSHQQENMSPIFKCLQCDQTFVNKEELLNHNHDTGVKSSQALPKLKCTLCDFTTTNMEGMKNHAQTHQDFPLKCDLCDFEALSTRSLKSHMKRHANDQRFVQQPLEQYKCKLCGYVCHHLPSLKSHMWRHASDSNYSYQKTNDIINAAIDYDITATQTQISQPLSEKAVPPPNTQAPVVTKVRNDNRDSLVTFRCCQCGFESVEKALLHLHMKKHLDIIQKTMEIKPFQDAN